MSNDNQVVFSRSHMRWFDVYMRMHVTRRTHGVFVDGHLDWSPDSVHVLLAQHVSSLDGFVVRHLQRRDAPDARLVTIMLNRQLKRYPVFRKAGAFGITPGSLESGKALIRMVKTELSAGDCVALFPQGRIETVDADPRTIRTGFRRFAHPHLPTRFIPVALSFEALHHSKPSLFIRVGDAVGLQDAEDAFVETVSSLRAWLRSHGETALEHWPGEKLF